MAEIYDCFSVFEDDVEAAASEANTALKKNHKKKNQKGEENDSLSAKNDEVIKSIIGEKRSLEDSEEDEESSMKRTKPLLEDINLSEYMSRIKVHTLETAEACTHEVAVPPDFEYTPLRPAVTKPAKEYPFILDPFQKESILCLENNQSVLVSAHTSAGKTVVAEYAISMSLRDKQRVIYTTPIKALSNQKYREFFEEFKDVGLMTGDVTINPTASCLIMTTEILRSMLYRGSEITREVAWVVFDEIHYMRDKERGVVWEETIILLPDNVHFVFLSATIPNARQFAEWITHLHNQACHVVYTDYRPVPLQHFIFPAGGDGLHLVVDDNGDFREENFNTAMSVLEKSGVGKAEPSKGKKGGPKGDSGSCYKIIKMILERNLAPAIVFSFSKKSCESFALQLSKLDFNTAEEKTLVVEVFNNAMDVLSEEDKKLPQVEQVLPLLKRGIGIHHSGLLPILKETIEILFAEGLLKVLFATETFAMGLNMPARTVLFTSARKFDGKDYRWISSGEYIQMSGRAGRRGLDDKGIVILMVDESMSPSVGKNIVKGLADPLNSAFHLTYNMVLNLLRVEGINPEYMLERSFFQFQNYSAIPALYDKLKTLQEEYDSFRIKSEMQVASYHKVRKQLDTLSKDFQTFITKPQYIIPFIQPGRLIKVKNGQNDFGWGVVINFHKKHIEGAAVAAEPQYIVDALLHLTEASARTKITTAIKPCLPGEKGEMQVVPILLHTIQEISSVRVLLPNDLKPLDKRMSVLKTIQEVKKRFNGPPPRLDPQDDMGIKEGDFLDIVKKIEAFEDRLHKHPLSNDPDLEELYNQYDNKAQLESRIKVAKTELKKAKSLLQMDELKCRKRVLRRLGYCTAADVIEIKGRVACEISSADELLVTEMLFNGAFNDVTVQQVVALLSCMVFEERASEMPKLTEELSGPLRLMQDTARRIAKISIEAKLELDEEIYVDSFKPHLMDVVYAWCNGASFANVCKMTDVFEGSIIRCLRRLEEFLRQMCQASKGIGNTDLDNKFSEGIRQMKRDIAFAASLYL